jgi:hypothetical protein
MLPTALQLQLAPLAEVVLRCKSVLLALPTNAPPESKHATLLQTDVTRRDYAGRWNSFRPTSYISQLADKLLTFLFKILFKALG